MVGIVLYNFVGFWGVFAELKNEIELIDNKGYDLYKVK
jgi:hypothetical protein